MRARSTHRGRAVALVGAIAMAGCGGGERQDENEPEGEFEVEVVNASFPPQQKLARSSELLITVRNAGSETVPNITLTVDGFGYRSEAADLADSARPRFAVNGEPVEIGGFAEARTATPKGCDTAYVNTWACGPLRPDRERTFRWSVTAVKAGPFKIAYTVAGGLSGKAKAVVAPGQGTPGGTFSGTISDKPGETRVGEDGRSVVTD